MEQNSASQPPSDVEPEGASPPRPESSAATSATGPAAAPEAERAAPADAAVPDAAIPDAGAADDQDASADAAVEAAPRDISKMGKPQDRVLRYLRRNITPALPADMAPAIGIELKPLQRLLGKMAREGTVRRSGGGRFTASRFRRDA